MAIENGSAFLLKIGNGSAPPTFATVAGLRTTQLSVNGEAVNVGGDPNLRVETSDATQAEINARIFKGDRRIRELSFRVDASYTRGEHAIRPLTRDHQNTGLLISDTNFFCDRLRPCRG